MKIRIKFLGTLCLFIVLLVILILEYTFYQHKHTTKSINNILNYQNDLELTSQLELALSKVIMPANDYLIHGDEEERDTFEDLDAEVNRLFEMLEGIHYPARSMLEEREMFSSLKSQYASLKNLSEKIFRLPSPSGNTEGARLMEEMDLLAYNMLEDMKVFHRSSQLGVLAEIEVLNACFTRHKIIMLSILAVIVAVSLFYGVILTRGFITPIRSILEGMGNVARGDFSHRLEIKTKDEVGTLTERFNWMTEKLKVTHDTIKTYSNKLEDSERQFHLLAENIPGVSWMSDSKLNEIIYISPSYEKIFGRTCKSLYEKPRSFLDAVHPDDLDYVLAAIKKYEQGVYDVEYRIVRPNSSVLWIWANAFPLRNKQGKIHRMIGIAQDITERKRIELELRELTKTLEKRMSERTMELAESEEKFRNISTSAQDAIIMAGDEGKVSYCNDATQRIFGYSKEETIGKTVHELIIPKRYHNDHLKGYGRFLKTGQGNFIGATAELAAVRKDGTEFPIELSLSGVKIKDKWNAIGIIRDITKRKDIEEQLMMSYKMASLGRLTAGVFHEVLNPLNIISSYAQLLLTEAEKGSKTEKDLKKIREEVDRIVKITDGLLRFARKGDLEVGEVKVNSLLEKTISIVEPDMKLDNIKFIKKLEGKLPGITASSDELRQVFLNLITNAKDTMPEGGTLTISTQSIKKRGRLFIRIEFADTGCGIASENISRVFDPFFTTKEEGKGTGLGLSTSYGIIDNHGGIISVESEKGKGATFIIDLPVKD